MNQTKSHTATLLFGIFTAGVIILSQLFFFQASTGLKKAAAEKKETKSPATSDDQAVITLPSSSLPSAAVAVELNQEGVCLFEILFEQETNGEPSPNLSLSPGKFFHTLFRVIISPNAP